MTVSGAAILLAMLSVLSFSHLQFWLKATSISTLSRSRRNIEAGHTVAWCARITGEGATLQRLRALTRFAAVARLARHLPHGGRGQSRICTYQAGPLNTLPTMTLLAPRPDRSLTPHTFVVPVVREVLSPSETLKAAGVSPSSLW